MAAKTMAQKKAELMAKPEFKAAYDALEEEFNLARSIIEARVRAGLTQEEVAARMQTTQSAVARLESGKITPSTATLQKFAKATGSRLCISFQSAC